MKIIDGDSVLLFNYVQFFISSNANKFQNYTISITQTLKSIRETLKPQVSSALLLMYSTVSCLFLFITLFSSFFFLTNIGGSKNICTKLLKGINSLYQYIGFLSLIEHIIKHIGNSEGEFFNIEYQIRQFQLKLNHYTKIINAKT